MKKIKKTLLKVFSSFTILNLIFAQLLLVGLFIFPLTTLAAATTTSVTLDGGSTVTKIPGATISATVNVTTSGTNTANDWKSTAWRIGSGSFTCINAPNHTSSGNYSETFDITAPDALGTYDAEFIAYNSNNCTTGAGNTFTLTNSVTVISLSDTGWKSPNTDVADTGGDGDGFEINPEGAYADGNDYAENENGADDRHRYYDYNFDLPDSATIYGIEVRLDWWLSGTYGTNSMSVRLSWDGGTSWTSAKSTTGEPTSETTSILGDSSDQWGQSSWSVSDFSNANFRLRITSNSSVSTRDFYLDWIPIKVYYTAPASVCGNGVLETGEQCESPFDTCCDSSTCQFESSQIECRASVGDCDLAETCTGSSASCPADSFSPSSTVCRAPAGACDLEEKCTGASVDCPADAKSTSECRSANGVCDLAEYCDGINNDCPIDSFQPAQTSCEDGLYCNGHETCDGNGNCQVGTLVDCSANNISNISTCNWSPDDNSSTWDFRKAFTSQCDEDTDSCTLGDQTITSTCDVQQCQAECDATHPCSETNCNQLDGCVGNDYYNYDNVANKCQGDCTCTDNACGAPNISYNDPACTECQTDDDCNSLDQDYCEGTAIKHDEGICLDYQCQKKTITLLDCDNSLTCDGQESCQNASCVSGVQVDCSQYNLPGIDTCLNDPDGNPYTCDYRAPFISECQEPSGTCLIGDEAITHTCDADCGGCEKDADCDDQIPDTHDTCNLSTCQCEHTPTTSSVSGYKWNDLNGNGEWDKEEPALSDWEIKATQGDIVKTILTNLTGFYEFIFNPSEFGDWIINEILQPSWRQSSPQNSDSYNVLISESGQNETNKNFGNIYFLEKFNAKFSPASGDAASTNLATVLDSAVIEIPVEGGTSTISFTAGTKIAREDGENFDLNALLAESVSNDSLTGLGTGMIVGGALKWGLDNLALTFDPVINVKIFVGTDLNGETLDIVRSISGSSGWTSNGINGIDNDTDLATCLVSAGYCSFSATKASYYAATYQTPPSLPTGGGGGGGFTPLTVANETLLSVSENSATITWTTNYFASSYIIYSQEGESHLLDMNDTGGNPPKYGYMSATAEYDTNPTVTFHSVILTGLAPNTIYYYRTVSRGSLAISPEYSFTTLQEITQTEQTSEEITFLTSPTTPTSTPPPPTPPTGPTPTLLAGIEKLTPSASPTEETTLPGTTLPETAVPLTPSTAGSLAATTGSLAMLWQGITSSAFRSIITILSLLILIFLIVNEIKRKIKKDQQKK